MVRAYGFCSRLGHQRSLVKRHRRRDAADRVASKGHRDRDDASTGLLRQHLLNGELGNVEEAFEVGRDERPKVLGRVVGERFREENTRVVDERDGGRCGVSSL
jgi:hypothetical protein